MIRCYSCGKFMKLEPGSSWAYVPDSDISFEEQHNQCKKCTKKYGPPVPYQNVNLEVCQGIY